MSKLFYFLLSILYVFISSRSLGEDCDWAHHCETGLVCKDYRCVINYPDTKDNQVKWTKKGPKCNWFHYCKKGYKCKKHRCMNKETGEMYVA